MLQRRKPLTRKRGLRRMQQSTDVPDATAAAERALRTMLDGRQFAGLTFCRRQTVGPFRVDFYCPAARLAVLLATEDEDERVKVAWLQSQGHRVLVVAPETIKSNPQDALDAIAAAFTLRVISRNTA